MIKKYIVLLKETKKPRAVAGLFIGITAFILCLCIAVISIVYSPSVYQAAYRKGCVDSAYNIDSDNFDKYYTVLTNFLTDNDADILSNSEFKANDSVQKIFTQSDIQLLQKSGTAFLLIRILAIISALIITVWFIALGLTKGKKAVSETACWSFVSYLSLIIILFVAIGVSGLFGDCAVYLLYQILTLGGLASYGTGNLALFYGKVTMRVFSSALLTMIAIFAFIMLAIIVSLCRAVYKKSRDENEDFLYQ